MKNYNQNDVYRVVCFCCSTCTYSQAFDKMPPFDCPSIAAILKRPLSPISTALPSAGMILPNFIIQWLILSRRLRSTSLCVALLRSSRFLKEPNGSIVCLINNKYYISSGTSLRFERKKDFTLDLVGDVLAQIVAVFVLYVVVGR